MTSGGYYRPDLARIHHEGFGFHADACAPGVLALLAPVLDRGGLVLEVGCGSGRLTRHLVDAGHRVVASDASPAMVDLARAQVPEAEAIAVLHLPDDPLPEADAIVSVGHVISYLPDEAAIDRALVAMACALRPAGILAIDICDLSFGPPRQGQPPYVDVRDDWAIVTWYPPTEPNRFVRDITTFVRQGDGSWRRDDEVHENVLVDTSALPEKLGEAGLDAEIRVAFGVETLPQGLHVVVARRS